MSLYYSNKKFDLTECLKMMNTLNEANRVVKTKPKNIDTVEFDDRDENVMSKIGKTGAEYHSKYPTSDLPNSNYKGKYDNTLEFNGNHSRLDATQMPSSMDWNMENISKNCIDVALEPIEYSKYKSGTFPKMEKIPILTTGNTQKVYTSKMGTLRNEEEYIDPKTMKKKKGCFSIFTNKEQFNAKIYNLFKYEPRTIWRHVHSNKTEFMNLSNGFLEYSTDNGNTWYVLNTDTPDYKIKSSI